MYTLDQGATFDPTDLTEDITPQVMPTAPHSFSLAPSGNVIGATLFLLLPLGILPHRVHLCRPSIHITCWEDGRGKDRTGILHI